MRAITTGRIILVAQALYQKHCLLKRMSSGEWTNLLVVEQEYWRHMALAALEASH